MRFLLIDTENLAHRAYHATARPKPGEKVLSHAGFPTNAISTLFAMLGKLVRQTEPDRVILGLGGESHFRSLLWPAYKANREEKPEALRAQLPVINRILMDSGLEYVAPKEDESDDALMTLAKMATGRNSVEVLLVSSDKDFGQVVAGNVFQLKPPTQKGQPYQRFGRDEIMAAYGVWPEQIPAYLALVGDAADNIDGVDGVGPDGAVKLLAGGPSFEQLVERVAAKRKCDRKLAEDTIGLFLKLTTYRHIEGLKPVRGAAQEEAFLKLEQLDCATALASLSDLLRDFGPGAVRHPQPPPPPF